MSGAMFITGEKSAPPLGPGPDIAQNTTGATAALAVLVALYQRGVTGEGDQIDISAHESSIDLIETAVSGFLTKGGVAQRGTHAFAPWGLFSCRDGYVTVISAPFRKWRAGSAMFEEPRLLDEKYRLVRDRVKYREEVQELIQPWLNGHTREETCERAYAKGLAFAPLATIEEGARSPQHKAREFFTEIDHPAAGRHKYSAAPFRMSATPYVTHRAPTLGEHNQAVYCDKLGLSAAALGELKTAGVI
jgi:crotonobetainyl-CoA:carnitine CoA-transferase CaiB-like acyl-CoA transferase